MLPSMILLGLRDGDMYLRYVSPFLVVTRRRLKSALMLAQTIPSALASDRQPGDAANSYIVIKLEGRQTVGAKMPLGGSLDAISLQNIKNWINKGAKNN